MKKITKVHIYILVIDRLGRFTKCMMDPKDLGFDPYDPINIYSDELTYRGEIRIRKSLPRNTLNTKKIGLTPIKFFEDHKIQRSMKYTEYLKIHQTS